MKQFEHSAQFNNFSVPHLLDSQHWPFSLCSYSEDFMSQDGENRIRFLTGLDSRYGVKVRQPSFIVYVCFPDLARTAELLRRRMTGSIVMVGCRKTMTARRSALKPFTDTMASVVLTMMARKSGSLGCACGIPSLSKWSKKVSGAMWRHLGSPTTRMIRLAANRVLRQLIRFDVAAAQKNNRFIDDPQDIPIDLRSRLLSYK